MNGEAVQMWSERLPVIGYAILASISVCYLAYRLGFFRIPVQPDSGKSFFLSFMDVFAIFILFISLEVFLVPSIAFVWFSLKSGEWVNQRHFHLTANDQGWLNIWAMFASAIGIFGYLSLRPDHQRSIGMTKKSFFRNFFLGALTWFICYPLVVVLDQALASALELLSPQSELEQVAVQQLKLSMENPTLFYLLITFIILIVPIIEETLFRGFLQTWLRQKIPALYAILLSSFVFAGFHFSYSQGIGNIELLSSLFLLSLFLGYLFERQKSLWAPIGLHMTFNSISVMMIIWESLQ